jgi:hypothetical protein
LASNPDWLSDLVSVLAAGGQPDCVFQEQGALCNLVKSGSTHAPDTVLPGNGSGEGTVP